MSQSKRKSLVESVTNVLVGYGIAILSQLLVFPLFGIDISLSDNFAIAAWFTVISIVRSYSIRRWFNRKIKSQQCLGIEIEPGVYSGCNGKHGDCPVCGK